MNWWHWHTEPELIGGLLAIAWLYAVWTGPWRDRLAPGRPYPLRQAVCFYSGLVLMYLTVGSPLDYVGEIYLLSAHMLQHVLLMYPIPILVICGMPDWLTRPVLTKKWVALPFGFLTNPLVAGLIFVATLSAWHIPFLYELALQSRLFHNLEHVTMFGSAFLVWWLIFSRSLVFPALSWGAQILFIFLISLGKLPVAAVLTFSSEVLYPTYEFAPRITGLSALDDQITGGAIKTLLAKFFGVFIIGRAFYHWSRESESDAAGKLPAPSPETVSQHES